MAQRLWTAEPNKQPERRANRPLLAARSRGVARSIAAFIDGRTEKLGPINRDTLPRHLKIHQTLADQDRQIVLDRIFEFEIAPL